MRQIIALLSIAFLPSIASAALKIASPFTDHAVLQRDMPVPVWGKAKPGAQISVSLAGQKRTAKADQSGRWRITLAPLKGTAKGTTMTITALKSKITLKDIVVGEVWICSASRTCRWDGRRI